MAKRFKVFTAADNKFSEPFNIKHVSSAYWVKFEVGSKKDVYTFDFLC